MISRRAFFRRAVVAATALTIADDPERLLWTPGAKTISIPSPRVLSIGEWLAAASILDAHDSYQRAYNQALATQMELIRRSPITLVGPFKTVSFQWTPADFATPPPRPSSLRAGPAQAPVPPRNRG